MLHTKHRCNADSVPLGVIVAFTFAVAAAEMSPSQSEVLSLLSLQDMLNAMHQHFWGIKILDPEWISI